MSGIEQDYKSQYTVDVPKHVGNRVLVTFCEETSKAERYSDPTVKVPTLQTAGSHNAGLSGRFEGWSANPSYNICGEQTYPRSIEQRLLDIENKIAEILEAVRVIRKVVI